MNVPAERVREQIVTLLTAWGMDPQLVRIAAEVMVETDLAGVDSHGVSMLMDYEQSRLKGKLNLKAKPKVVRETTVTALVDADAGLGHPAAVMGMELAIAKARKMHVGVVTVFNSHHFGAAGYYAALASKAGMVGMVTSATRTISTVPTRARVPVLGTNPIAFAAPTKKNRPFLLDMATASVAANKLKVYDLNGKKLPPGWVLDGEGQAVTDPALGMKIVYETKKGGLTPVGGTAEMSSYKGYGLAMMAHILGGALSGASFSPIRNRTQKPSDPDNLGHFFLAIDPKAYRPEGAFESDLDAAIDVLHETPPVDLREGIPMPVSLVEKIQAICQRSGARFIL